jgi:carboxylesterase
MSLKRLDATAKLKLGRHALFEKRGSTGVLLIHGITGAPTEVKPVARRLAARGFTVACPPLAGHCSSLRDLKRTRWTDWYRSVVAGFDFLRAQCEAVFVSGLSMGALLALKLAAERPDEIRGVATMSATFCYDGWNVPRLKQRLLLPIVLHTPLRYLLSYREPAPYGIKDERLRNIVATVYGGNHNNLPEHYGYSEFPGVTVLESFRLIKHVKRRLPRVVAPTLILHAMEDDMASVENARFLARQISSRRIECCYFDDTYHVLTMDRRRDDVAECISQFVARFAVDTASHAAVGADRTETIEVSRTESIL